MHARHLIIPALAVVLLLGAGCDGRSQQVEADELRAENRRLSQEFDQLRKEAKLLEQQRNSARDELVRYREHADGLSEQLRRSLAAGALPTGMEMTDGGAIALPHDFAFPLGSAELNEAGLSSLRELARLLNSGEYAQTNIIVSGHTDKTPVVREETKRRFGDNWGLSAMRSAAVVRALQQAGVSPSRLRGAFFGEHNSTGQGAAADRRVEILVSL